MNMETRWIPFRLPAEARVDRLREFNSREEIRWFGFEGSFLPPATARIAFRRIEKGALGGGGTDAINGGVIAAGFDAAFVLAGLGQYSVDVVVTLDLSIQFLNLARVSDSVAFHVGVVKSSKNFCFASGVLFDPQAPDMPHFARATAMLAPAR